MPAGATPIEMASEAAVRNARLHGARPLLHTEPRMLLEEGVALRVEDIGHLHGGPAHDCGGFRNRRDRGITGGSVTCNCSSGLGAAWRCRRERWRYTVVCDRSAAQQELNGAQVSARFQEMRRVHVPQRVRCHAFVDARLRAARRTASQITFVVIGASARQPRCVPGKR